MNRYKGYAKNILNLALVAMVFSFLPYGLVYQQQASAYVIEYKQIGSHELLEHYLKSGIDFYEKPEYVVSSGDFTTDYDIEYDLGNNLDNIYNYENIGDDIRADVEEDVKDIEDVDARINEADEYIASLIHQFVNKERMENGLHALSYDNGLEEVAEETTKDISDTGYFSHTGIDGDGPTDRALDVGYGDCTKDKGTSLSYGIAENLYSKSGGIDSAFEIAKDAVEEWIESPGHRQNIFNGEYDSQGISVDINGDDVVISQDFC